LNLPAARQIEVRMLVIDEIHSILAGTFPEQRIVLNAIRFLTNDLRIPLVCVGVSGLTKPNKPL
jgi:Bacterial TniB protein